MPQNRHIILDDDLDAQIVALAEREDRSLAWIMRALMRKGLAVANAETQEAAMKSGGGKPRHSPAA